MTRLRFLLAGLALLLGGCTGNANIKDYENRYPTLDLRQYLSGDVDAWGVFIDRHGVVTREFHVAIKGSWIGNDGTLEEEFDYTDGKHESRVWHIHFDGDHSFTGKARDVVGEAKGAQYGNAVNMNYTLRIPVDDDTYDVQMNDWMYLMTNDTLLNHTTLHKFGFKVGELFLTFRKRP